MLWSEWGCYIDWLSLLKSLPKRPISQSLETGWALSIITSLIASI